MQYLISGKSVSSFFISRSAFLSKTNFLISSLPEKIPILVCVLPKSITKFISAKLYLASNLRA
jgi:hypothetical protein